jgi:hypothetical protein
MRIQIRHQQEGLVVTPGAVRRHATRRTLRSSRQPGSDRFADPSRLDDDRDEMKSREI